MAPSSKKAAAPKVYDYSDLEKGMKLQASSDGTWYAAEVVTVSTAKAKSKAPVKVSYIGYEGYDEWVGGDRLRSKALKVAKKETTKPERAPLEFEFGYWGIRGLGAVFRMIFEYKGAKYKDNQYTGREDWFERDKPKILEKNPLANLPWLTCGNDTICQTNACLNYLGSRLRMSGGGYKARQLNEQLLCEIYDVRNTMIDMAYPFKEVCRTEEEHKAKVVKVLEGGPFKKFEAILEKGNTDFFCGKTPCTSDFHIWEMLDQHKMLAEKHAQADIFTSIPKCKAFYDKFRALPQLQKYFDSDSYKLPVNNQAAGAYFA
eukprot:TRINITY_DN1425_c0_g1_i1.p1 TRINITY_DN1425_c0_g1~~TRINITY_DN1425_c0_g1_i1.p1  ORF type:complete len:340 (+),score=78.64 TRINITY_DN1425_c0_g1_i1:72-1022(+)